MISGEIIAQNNTVLISSSGDSNNVITQQEGLYNSAFIQQVGHFGFSVQNQEGIENTIGIMQLGSNNYSQSTQLPSAVSNTAQQYQSGDYNVTLIIQGEGSHNLAIQNQTNNTQHNKAVIVQRGSNNKAEQTQEGLENSVGEGWFTIINNGILQEGNENVAAQAQYGDFNNSSIIQTGDLNNASVNQIGQNNNSKIRQSNQ